MYFVSTQLSLPLFLVTRTRYKYHRPRAVRKYIRKRRNYYIKHCNEGHVNSTATHKRQRHLAGLYEHNSEKCQRNARILDSTRELIKPRPWELPPNLYNAKATPFIGLKGIGGALWQKVHKSRSIKKKEKLKYVFYDIECGVDRLLHSRNRHKGVFLSNVRERRPTERNMISDLSIRYYVKPRPALYFPKQHLIEYNIAPKMCTKMPPSHIFYPQTSVPVRDFPSAIVKPHNSFAPGPGRYDIRFPKSCPCSRKIYAPDLQADIDRAKRQKFRRLPYKPITAHRYCTPEWRHVVGQGHRRLFKTPSGGATKKVFERKPVTAEKHLQLYPTGQYINLITNPKRTPISIWPNGYREFKRPLRFNCIAKRIIRKQLRYNRKIAFDSGRERFSDLERQPSLTAAQIETIKMSLPESRRLQDYPVMRCEPEEIVARLQLKPKHQMPPENLVLRKRLYKFPKLPMPKVLVTPQDIRDKSIIGKPNLFYSQDLMVTDYFKSDVMRDLYIKHGYHRRSTGQKKELTLILQ